MVDAVRKRKRANSAPFGSLGGGSQERGKEIDVDLGLERVRLLLKQGCY